MTESEAHAKSDVESGEYERYYKIQPGDTVLDIGAHVGFFSQSALDKAGPSGRVIAFEPHPDNFRKLIELLKAHPNFFCYNVACLDSDGEGTLWNNPQNSGAHSLFRESVSNAAIPVWLINTGRWMARHGACPQFVKIDAEGAEARIIQSILQAIFYPQIAVECHSDGLYQECRNLCEKAGYEFFPKEPHVGVCHAVI